MRAGDLVAYDLAKRPDFFERSPIGIAMRFDEGYGARGLGQWVLVQWARTSEDFIGSTWVWGEHLTVISSKAKVN